MVNTQRRGVFVEFLFWVALAAIGTYFVWPLKDRPRKGIDLVGGFYITLKVDTDEGLRLELLNKKQSLLTELQNQGFNDPVSHKVENHAIFFQFKNVDDAQKSYMHLKDKATLNLNVHQNGDTVQVNFPETISSRIKEQAVEGTVDVLRKRLDSMGVAEIPVSRQGDQNIIIELPNVDDPAQAKQMIGKTSNLEFKEVMAVGASEDDILDRYDGILPEGMMIVTEDTDSGQRYYLVADYTDLTGRDLKYASFGRGQRMEASVKIEFNDEGAQKFADLTKKCRGKSVAMILDDKVVSAPNVNEPITGGHAQISGNFTPDSAKNLATMLRSGSFFAPLTFEEERRIGPSLGAESINQGIISCAIGMLLLFVFSVFVYKAAGFLAFLVLIYNLLLIIFFLYWINATLTLPGIAGMVLTVGMAIDCSILVFERIREALKEGVSYREAVDIGFSDAMGIILDSNITTFLIGIVLYYFGTGLIQGFAITLMLGIISTLITGLLLLKTLFKLLLDGFNLQRISI